MNAEYQIEINENREDVLWDSFVEHTPGGHHVQTSLWAEVKAALGWRAIRILVYKSGLFIGGSQLLLKSYPLIGSIVYIPKGPLLAYDDVQLLDLLLSESIRVSRAHHFQILAVQPAYNDILASNMLLSKKFTPSLLELAPTASILLDLLPPVDAILGSMKRQTRQNIKRSMREGITTREGTEDDLNQFYRLHVATSKRQRFTPYPEIYFKQMWKIFSRRGKIGMLIAEFEREPVSALLLIAFGETVIAKLLGWSGMHPNRRPNDAVFWAAIEWSKANGYKWFDFEGIGIETAKSVLSGGNLTEAMKHSPDFIKLGFGGQAVLYPPAFEILPNPTMRWIYNKLSPRIGNPSSGSRLLEWLRKR